MSVIRAIAVAAGAAILVACTFVELSKEGEKVRLVETGEIMGCKYLGQVTASVAERIGIVGRREESVQANVNVLARNAAADLGGDTIKAADNLKDGKQKFDVYRCLSK